MASDKHSDTTGCAVSWREYSADLYLSASIQEMILLKDCNDLLKQYWKESTVSLDEAQCELPPAAG